MKRIYRLFFALLLSFVAVFSQAHSISATPAQDDTAIANLIYYHINGLETDELRTLSEIKSESVTEYEKWSSIIDYWTWLENDMVENIGVAPDGLPTGNNHAFVVLGFALNADGTMTPELEGRLQVALDSANKYPNSYVLVTGGVEKNGWTEGQRMYDWLVANGLDSSRIIKEDQSTTTVENAQFSFNKLYNDYNVNSISIITSQYHLKRGMLLYYTESLESALKYNKEPIKIVSNAGWFRSDKTSEPLTHKAYSLATMAGGNVLSIYNSLTSSTVQTSTLQDITVNGQLEYDKGEPLNISVIANYDVNNFKRDVTNLSIISGYDSSKLGKQNILVEYTERGITKNITLAINVKDPSSVNAIGPKAGDYTEIGAFVSLLYISLFAIIYRLKRKEV